MDALWEDEENVVGGLTDCNHQIWIKFCRNFWSDVADEVVDIIVRDMQMPDHFRGLRGEEVVWRKYKALQLFLIRIHVMW